MQNNTTHIWKTMEGNLFLETRKARRERKFSPCRLGCAAWAPLTLTLESDKGNSRPVGSLAVMLTRIEAGSTGLLIPVEARNFRFVSESRPALGPTQPTVQWVRCAFSRL